MAMTTRFRAKKKEENMETSKIKLIESKFTTSKPQQQQFGTMDDKRKAFGELNHRRDPAYNEVQKFGLEKKNSAPPQNGSSSIVYKDVKARVDTRWKKDGNLAQKPPLIKSSSTIGITGQLTRQNSIKLSNENLANKKIVKSQSITQSIITQVKKTTAITSAIELKKPVITSTAIKQTATRFEPLIKSPKQKIQRVPDVGRKFYESHSTHLLHMVENIDEKDKSNPQLLSVYVNDIYAYLMRLEKIFPIRESFLQSQMDVTPKMRSVLLDWINEVHSQFNLENETFHMAVSMIDRYLQVISSTSRRHLQLVGVTALFMASKYEELMPPEISDFVYVTDDTYSKEDILKMELKIFRALEFNLSKPLPIHFLRRFTKAAGSLGDRQYNASKYFLELAAIDYELTKYKPSEIAAASLYLSLYIHNKIKNDSDLWTPTLQFYSTYNISQIMPIVKRLAMLVFTAKEAKLKSVYNKYSQPHFKFASNTAEMTGTKIQELVRI